MKDNSMRRDPAFSFMPQELLENVLSRADNPRRLIDYLTKEIRELTGARCVLFLQCMGEEHRILGVNPEQFLAWAESPEGERLHAITHGLSETEVWDPEISSSEISQILKQSKFGMSMAIPLSVGAVKIGAMLVLDLPDQQHIASKIKLLTTPATIVALVLQNAFLFENQEQTIVNRTKELFLSAITCDNMQDMVFWVSPDASFWKVNASACKMLGYSNDELLNFSVGDVIPNFPMETWQDHWQELKQTGSLHFETTLQTKDGRIIPVDISANFMNLEGNEYNCSIVRDISKRKLIETALRKSEERFELAMRASSDGIFDWDLKTQHIYFSPGWKRMLGYRDEKLGNDFSVWEKLMTPEEQARFWKILNEHLQGKRKRFEMEFQMLHKSGHWVDILSRASAIFDASGTPVRVVGTHVDITEQKRAEKERLRLKDQLTQAQKMESVGRLAGGVAHDFNNMLGVILGRTEMLMEETDPTSPLFAALREIRKAAERSADLTRQLLAFARKQTIAPRLLDLNETVEGMLKLLRRLIGEDIDLAWLPSRSPGLVNMDPSQIDQILANLCVNARDAIAGVGKIIIETGCVVIDKAYCDTHPDAAPGEYVMLAVSDDGSGIDKQTMGQLFEPFFTTKDLGKGTGLGLATIYGIVKQNQGLVDVHSEHGQGTTFKIYLPKFQGEMSQEGEEENEVMVSRGHETILLVEDELIVLEMTHRLLQRLGYTVLIATNPREAIDLAKTHSGKINLLLTDVVMPEMNGRDLAKQLTSLSPDLKAVFMSGYTADVIAHHGVLDNDIIFIEKPFQKKALAAKIREALDQENGD